MANDMAKLLTPKAPTLKDIAQHCNTQFSALCKELALPVNVTILTPDDVYNGPHKKVSQNVAARLPQELTQIEELRYFPVTCSAPFGQGADMAHTLYTGGQTWGVISMGGSALTTREDLAQSSCAYDPAYILRSPKKIDELDFADTGLTNPAHHAPQPHVTQADKNRFGIYHEMGHILFTAWEDRHQEPLLNQCSTEEEALAQEEAFADTFAALMALRDTGNIDLIRSMADGRALKLKHMGCEGVHYLTHPALDRVLELAEQGNLPQTDRGIFETAEAILTEYEAEMGFHKVTQSFDKTGNLAAGGPDGGKNEGQDGAVYARVAEAARRQLLAEPQHQTQAEFAAMLAQHETTAARQRILSNRLSALRQADWRSMSPAQEAAFKNDWRQLNRLEQQPELIDATPEPPQELAPPAPTR